MVIIQIFNEVLSEKKKFPSWEVIFLFQKFHSVKVLKKKLVKKLLRNKKLCQTTLLLEFDNETNHFPCFENKHISKAAQQLRKSSRTRTCCHNFFLRWVGGGSTQQSKGLSLQFPPFPYPLA